MQICTYVCHVYIPAFICSRVHLCACIPTFGCVYSVCYICMHLCMCVVCTPMSMDVLGSMCMVSVLYGLILASVRTCCIYMHSCRGLMLTSVPTHPDLPRWAEGGAGDDGNFLKDVL